MGDVWLQLALVFVLIIVNALFAGSEMAFVSLREGQLRRLERSGERGRRVVRLARDPNRFLATIQIGITLAGFLASATAAVTLAAPIALGLRFLGGAARPVAVVLVTLVLTFLTLVFGEVAPKRVAMQHAERWARTVVRPLSAMAAVSRPVVWLLGRTTDLAVRLAGSDPRRHHEDVTPAEIRDLVTTHRGFTPEQRMIISGAVEIAERTLREILVPRRVVFTLDVDAPLAQSRQALAASGHSRAPVLREGDLDEPLGVVALRDLVQAPDILAAARPPYLLPETLRVADALRRFKNEREQFALVVDEYGSVGGIVTLEDLLEELVGELYDDYDKDISAVRVDADGSLTLPGTFPVHDLPDLGVELEPSRSVEFATVAGMVIARLGHLPTGPGESVTVDGWTARVISVDHHTVTGVRLKRAGA